MELYLSTFSLSVTSIGLCYLSLAISYTTVTLASGYLVDKLLHPGTLTILGFILLLISFTFLAPVPYLYIHPHLAMTVTSMVMYGAGTACITLSSFSSCLQATLSIDGYSQSISTTSIVSGIWTAGYSLGHFIGPLLGGVMYEKVNFFNFKTKKQL